MYKVYDSESPKSRWFSLFCYLWFARIIPLLKLRPAPLEAPSVPGEPRGSAILQVKAGSVWGARHSFRANAAGDGRGGGGGESHRPRAGREAPGQGAAPGFASSPCECEHHTAVLFGFMFVPLRAHQRRIYYLQNNLTLVLVWICLWWVEPKKNKSLHLMNIQQLI